jgi:hypothetical protein
MDKATSELDDRNKEVAAEGAPIYTTNDQSMPYSPDFTRGVKDLQLSEAWRMPNPCISYH